MFRSSLIALGIFLALNLGSGKRVRYDNFHVYKVTPKNNDEVKILADLEGATATTTFLDSVHILGKSMHIAVAPKNCADFQQTLNQSNIEYELVNENLQKRLDHEIKITSRGRAEYNWTHYHTLRSTNAWLNLLAKKFPERVEVIIGGSTYEGRKIKGVKVSFKKGNKGIFIEGGIHAREWISSATVTYILNELLTSQDPQVREIAENYDWYVFPHTNPDGYVYTHTTNRLWRKTRSYGLDCYGADPNRNWNFYWNETGASSLPCSDTYAGKKPFSEIEVLSLSKYIESLNGKIHIYLSFHSYSQVLVFPYGYTKEHTDSHNDLQQIGDIAAKALAMRYGTSYAVGSLYEIIYPAAGTSIDWAYGKANISLSYCYELRATSNDWDGFLISAENIIPIGAETLDSVVALINEAKSLAYI